MSDQSKTADQSRTADQIDPMMKPFMEFWSSFLGQTSETTSKVFETNRGSADSHTLNREQLDAASENMEHYLRSPEFLNALKKNIEAMITTKRQLNDLNTELAHNAGISTVGDVCELFERLDAVEQSVHARLARIERQLASIEGRLSR